MRNKNKHTSHHSSLEELIAQLQSLNAESRVECLIRVLDAIYLKKSKFTFLLKDHHKYIFLN